MATSPVLMPLFLVSQSAVTMVKNQLSTDITVTLDQPMSALLQVDVAPDSPVGVSEI